MTQKTKTCHRREFGRTLAAGALGATIAAGLSARAQTGPSADVILTGVAKGSPDDALKRAVKEAARAATDFGWLKPGQSVLIKPALNSGNPYPATTSPVAIAAMIELLREKGAGRVVVADMSGIEHVKLTPKGLAKGSSRELMHQAGMAQAALAAGGEIYFPEEAGWNAFYEQAPTQGSSWKNPLLMPKILQEVDHLVLMPRCARHVLAGSTLGLKCAVGWWRFDTRTEYHRDAATLQEKTAEANTVPSLLEKQRLVLSAATQVLTTFGPDFGHVVTPETGLVIASTSVVAHDMASLAWLIEHRRLTPSSQKNFAKDPNTNARIANTGNRLVVNWLAGMGEAAKAETLTPHPLETVGDDRVLNRAYQVFGGRPRLNVVSPDGSAPDSAVKLIQQATQAA